VVEQEPELLRPLQVVPRSPSATLGRPKWTVHFGTFRG
jgi:hypothetical protein